MAGFNEKNTRTKAPDTVNRSGHAAYAMGDEDKLVTQVLTTFINEPKYYGDNTSELIELAEKVVKERPGFVARLAVYARETMNMRTVSHVLAAVACRHGDYSALGIGEIGYARRMIRRLVVRGDDITNILATHYAMYGGREPNSMRRGLRDALQRLSANQIAKYQCQGQKVSMADAIKILHPNPANAGMADVYKKCMEGTLKVPESWKTAVSENADGETKSWNELIEQDKLPYMAALRNLRNLLNDKTVTDKNISKVMDMLSDYKEVRRSRQLPFRFISAYDAAMESSRCTTMVTSALEEAFDQSIINLPKLSGRTIVCIDVSGSMHCTVSGKSTVQCNEIAKQLGYIVAAMSDDAIVYTFDTQIRREDFSKRAGILFQVRALKNRGGGGTDMYLPFNAAIEGNIDCDRFVVLSDNEVNRHWGGDTVQKQADRYRDKMGKNVWLHAIDLQGYGTQQFDGSRTNILAGWSEKVLEFIPLVESAEGGLIDRIQKVEI